MPNRNPSEMKRQPWKSSWPSKQYGVTRDTRPTEARLKTVDNKETHAQGGGTMHGYPAGVEVLADGNTRGS